MEEGRRSVRKLQNENKPTSYKPSTSSGMVAALPPEIKLRRALARVPVVYYLTKSHQLLHPHFVEIPISSPDGGLYLRDVFDRLTVLRGKRMPKMYSWSCKRSYKNGFVWQDLSENDLVLPVKINVFENPRSKLLSPTLPSNGGEFVLKGSEIFEDPRQYYNNNSYVEFEEAAPLLLAAINGGDDLLELAGAPRRNSKTNFKARLTADESLDRELEEVCLNQQRDTLGSLVQKEVDGMEKLKILAEGSFPSPCKERLKVMSLIRHWVACGKTTVKNPFSGL